MCQQVLSLIIIKLSTSVAGFCLTNFVVLSAETLINLADAVFHAKTKLSFVQLIQFSELKRVQICTYFFLILYNVVLKPILSYKN